MFGNNDVKLSIAKKEKINKFPSIGENINKQDEIIQKKLFQFLL